MPSKFTYMVRLQNGKVGRTNSYDEAKKAVDKYGGAVARKTRKAVGNMAWDWPTFSSTGKIIYRKRK